MAKKARKARAKKAVASGSSVVNTDKFNYETTKIRGSDGRVRHSRGNQDSVAKALLIFVAGGGELSKVAKANGLADRMKGRDGLNAGMYRMTLGVMLRKLVRDGTPVTIGDHVVKTLEQRIAMPAEMKAA